MEPTPSILPISFGQTGSVPNAVRTEAAPTISSPVTCPQCHAVVRLTDYFCFNCGKNLKPAPPSTAFEKLFMYYLGAILLPPMGIVWGIKYVRSGDQKAKIHGMIMIVGTIVELIILTVWTIQFINTVTTQVNGQLNGQLNGLQGF